MTAPMYSAALVSAGTSSSSGFSLTGLLVLIVLVAIGFPLIRKLRRYASENRRRRWVESGLTDQPADPEPKEPSS